MIAPLVRRGFIVHSAVRHVPWEGHGLSKSLKGNTNNMKLYQRVRKSIPTKTVNTLWLLAGGRCQYHGCNIILWEDSLTTNPMNKAYISHVIAASPNGPRGDSEKSEELELEISNLMLLCDECHNRIDAAEVNRHTVEFLLTMKISHEERIRRVTGITEKKKTIPVSYLSKIGEYEPVLKREKAFSTLIDEGYFPALHYLIEGGSKSTYTYDNEHEYWTTEEKSLEQWYKLKVQLHLESHECKHLSVFALAPQPLLIKFGALLSEHTSATIYQSHREPQGSWSWKTCTSATGAKLIAPGDTNGVPALLISLSSPVNRSRVRNLFKNEAAIWEVTVDLPARDCIRTIQHLEEVKKVFREAFDAIRFHHPFAEAIHVFPVMPNSAAVEFGRVRMQKADLPVWIYDQNNKSGSFIQTIKIH